MVRDFGRVFTVFVFALPLFLQDAALAGDTIIQRSGLCLTLFTLFNSSKKAITWEYNLSAS